MRAQRAMPRAPGSYADGPGQPFRPVRRRSRRPFERARRIRRKLDRSYPPPASIPAQRSGLAANRQSFVLARNSRCANLPALTLRDLPRSLIKYAGHSGHRHRQKFGPCPPPPAPSLNLNRRIILAGSRRERKSSGPADRTAPIRQSTSCPTTRIRSRIWSRKPEHTDANRLQGRVNAVARPRDGETGRRSSAGRFHAGAEGTESVTRPQNCATVQGAGKVVGVTRGEEPS